MNSDIRICFVGDSFVNGTDDSACLGWAGRICVAMHERGIPVTYYNLGVRRNTTRDILQRWQAECVARLPESCDAWVVFSFGVNDIHKENGALRIPQDESFSNTRTILQEAVNNYRVLMVGPPPVADDGHNQRVQAFSEFCARETAGLGVPYVDLYPVLVKDSDYLAEVAANDGAHPKAGGYGKMTALVLEQAGGWFFRKG